MARFNNLSVGSLTVDTLLGGGAYPMTSGTKFFLLLVFHKRISRSPRFSCVVDILSV